MKKTTVTIDEKTKDTLAKFGTKGESFDTILQRVMSTTDSLCSKPNVESNTDEEQEE